MIQEALRSRLAPKVLLAQEPTELAARFPQARLVTRAVLEAVCDTKTPQGMCASFDLPGERALEDAPQTLVALDGVQDPGNVGTIWRTADAAGCCWARTAPTRTAPRCSARPWARAFGFRPSPRNPFRTRCERCARAAMWSSPPPWMERIFTRGPRWGRGLRSSSAGGGTGFPARCPRICPRRGDPPSGSAHARRRGIAQRGGGRGHHDV